MKLEAKMAKVVSPPNQAQVEEVINEAGKVYLPPCQIACPLGEDISAVIL